MLSSKFINSFFYTGVILCVLGSLDPIEGSILILIGSALISWSKFKNKEKDFTLYLKITFSIGVGVAFLFYLSHLGGFGCEDCISWWWGLTILPYPIAWLILAYLFFKWVFTNKTKN